MSTAHKTASCVILVVPISARSPYDRKDILVATVCLLLHFCVFTIHGHCFFTIISILSLSLDCIDATYNDMPSPPTMLVLQLNHIVIRLEPIMLKNLPIILSSISQKNSPFYLRM